MSEPDPPITDQPVDLTDSGHHADLRVHLPHLRGGAGIGADHFRALHSHSPSVVQQEAPVSHAPHQSVAASMAAEQLRTQAVQLADHLAARQQELDRREAELGRREAALEARVNEAHQWLTEREATVERLRREWLDQRKQAEAELLATRQRMDQQLRRDREELNERRRAVELRSEQLDRAAVAVQKMWDEIARLQRETLEQRLANEELAAQLAPLASPESRQRMLLEIRAKLAEEYRRANEELARRKQGLLVLRRELSNQYRKLAGERDRIHRLAAQLAADRRRHAVHAAGAKTEPVPRE